MRGLEIAGFAVGAAGVVVICWGVSTELVQFVRLEIRHLKGENICHGREVLRHHLGSYLLLGLEFLIAADIIDTILKPSFEEIGLLGATVAVRTVLNVFLNREMGNHKC